MGQRVRKSYLIDMDGVLVHGRHPIPGAAEFLARLDAAGHLDQELVAHRMAEHVVDFLQAIEVDAQHREFLVGTGAGLDHLRQRLQEGGAVRQVGQAVMIGHVRHPRFGLAAVGDVVLWNNVRIEVKTVSGLGVGDALITKA